MLQVGRKTVFVGLSGGVDSSVAAARLVHAGYHVVGVFIKVWQPEFLTCNVEAERLDAMRVAAHLGIPFLTFDAAEAYQRGVAEYLIEEYGKGRTPNPDVMCNETVKFGAFYRYALASGADCVATGHYAQSVAHGDGEYILKRGADAEKDQSYFLWSLPSEQLQFVRFPIGNSTKREVRAEAAAAGLPTAAKPDSQGICFLGAVDMREFLSHYMPLCPGPVLDERGEVVGRHDGALLYTLGQRHGFRITQRSAGRTPYYVSAKNIDTNTITVSQSRAETGAQEIRLSNTVWRGDTPAPGDTFCIQTRYRQTPSMATVLGYQNGTLAVMAEEHHERPTPGQSCVFYQGDVCLGGGIIQERAPEKVAITDERMENKSYQQVPNALSQAKM